MLYVSFLWPVQKSHELGFFSLRLFFFHLPISALEGKKTKNHCKKPEVKLQGLGKGEMGHRVRSALPGMGRAHGPKSTSPSRQQYSGLH